MNSNFLTAWACCAAILSTGCATHASIDTQEQAPAAWEQITGAVQWPSDAWYSDFGSDELNAFIAQSTQGNFDVAAAQARVLQADARARAAGAALLPQVDAQGNVAYNAGRTKQQSAHETDWSALLSASYEVDFWGKQHAQRQSATLAAAAGEADRAAVRLTTVASVADTYFTVLSLREQLEMARANLQSSRELLSVVQARFDAGAMSPVELATQKAVVAAAELAISPLAQQEVEARAALALLCGQQPENFAVHSQSLDDIAEPGVMPGLPAELLQRRPDVFAAEANLLAAHADLQAARAALFPSLTLTGSAGLQNPAMQAAVLTLSGSGYGLTLGADVVQTIFDGGRRHAQRDEAEAKEQELLANYRGAILDALRDVEVALSAVQHLNEQQSAQQENLAQSQRAFEGAQLRYRAGAGDYLTLLEAQRGLYTARQQWNQYKLARLQAKISLCKALGGGWQVPNHKISS